MKVPSNETRLAKLRVEIAFALGQLANVPETLYVRTRLEIALADERSYGLVRPNEDEDTIPAPPPSGAS